MKTSSIQILWTTYSKYRWHVLGLVVLGSLSAVLEGIGINAVIPLISFFSGGAGSHSDFVSRTLQAFFHLFSIPFTFRYLLGFILILFFLRAAASVGFGYIRGWISSDFLSDETESVLRATMLASWPFLLQQKIGALQSTVVRDIQRSSNLLEIVGQVIQSMSGFLMYLLVALNISRLMTILTVAGGAVLLIVVRPFLGRTRRFGEVIANTEKNFTHFLSEHIIGMKSVKAAGVERRALNESKGLIRDLRNLSIKMAFVRSANTSMFQPFSLVFVIILLALTYNSPDFSIISFAAVLYLIQKIFTYLESGQAALNNMSELIPYAENLMHYKVMLGEHREEHEKGEKPFIFKKSLAFKNVTLTYADGTRALEDVSFMISPGETVGLVGPSGAGKTSLVDTILRLFVPSSGALYLDGIDAREIGLEEWRHHIGYVSQDVFLFNGSIEENIRFYRHELSHEEIIDASRKANIYEFIESLPNGFATTVGDRGVLLSGGQRQRVALARALAGRSEMLILDEATSALDHDSEQLIQEAIQSLRGTVTVFVIAHRPSTVSTADHILVLEGGKIVEEGSSEELLENTHSYFHKMQRGI